MGLFSFFQRQGRQRSQAVPVDAGTLEEVRTRARRRLIGALVLVAAAVIVLPMLFDTKPRQLPANIDLQVERHDGAAGAPGRAAVQAPESEVGSSSDAPTAAPPDLQISRGTHAAPNEAQPSVALPKIDSKGRYVVQVGAFEQAQAAHDVRVRVEKLGLQGFEQSVNTSAGKRIRVRVGPYASRDDADRVAAQVRASGLNATVLTL